MTEFVTSKHIGARCTLKPQCACFLLISYNPNESPKYFQFRMFKENIEYKLQSYESVSADLTTGLSNIYSIKVNFSQIKKKSKVENIIDILKRTHSETFKGRGSRGDGFKDQEINDSFAEHDRFEPQFLQNSESIFSNLKVKASTMAMGGVEELETELDTLKRMEIKNMPPEMLQRMMNKQEKLESMMQTVIDMLRNIEPALSEARHSNSKLSQHTVSIGTNTTMKAQDLQLYLEESSLAQHETDISPIQKRRIISAYNEYPSLSQTLSGLQKSEGGSKSSNHINREDTHQSPGDDSNCEKKSIGVQMGFGGEETMSMNSSGQYTQNDHAYSKRSPCPTPNSQARMINRTLDSGIPKSYKFEGKASVGPHSTTYSKGPDYLLKYSTNMGSEKPLLARTTEGGFGGRGTVGSKNSYKMEEPRLPKSVSQYEFPQNPEDSYNDEFQRRPFDNTGKLSKGQFKESTDEIHKPIKKTQNQEANPKKEVKSAGINHSNRPSNNKEEDPIENLGILQGQKENILGSEHAGGGGMTTIEIPRIDAYERQDSSEEESEEDILNIRKKYFNK